MLSGLLIIILLPKWLIPFTVAGQGLDTISTYIALHSGRFVEQNPLMPSKPATNLAVKSADTAAMIYLIHKLDKKHPKAALWLGLVGGAAGFIPGIINYNRMRGSHDFE